MSEPSLGQTPTPVPRQRTVDPRVADLGTQLGQATPTQRPRSHLTIMEVCDELGISKSTFYDWRAAHKAPCCIRLPNGSLRVRRADFDRWLRECEEPA